VKNDGTEAQDEFEQAFHDRGFWVHRFRDSKDVNGLNKRIVIGRVNMFPCPSDFLVGGGGQLFLAEVKSTHSGKSFSYGDIRPAQRSAAGFAAAKGFPYFFYIKDMITGQWYVLSAEEFRDDIRAGVKSRKFEELMPCSLT
jgi:hypothetical protein